MKKLLLAVVCVLALNFVAVAGGIGWLSRSGHLDKAKIKQIKAMLFPPATQPSDADTHPVANASTQPSVRLDELMAKLSGRSAAEQVDFIQLTFDAQMLQLDRRQRDLADLQRQVDLANKKLADDRAAFEKEKQALASRQDETARLASDKGFQDSLRLYTAMPSKKVKEIFINLSPETVQQYLETMDPRTAAKIIKEFKTPSETAFIQNVLERMRQAVASGNDGKSS